MSLTITVTFKLYASLAKYLPKQAQKNQIDITVPIDRSITSLLDEYNVPLESAHLVLVNGLFIAPEERLSTFLSDKDVLAVWPPVAGG
jgi:molybdopterin converting factor small subunit